MEQSETDRINDEIERLRARLEAVLMQNNDLNRSLVDASRRIAELSAEVGLLKNDAETTDEEEDGDDGEAKEMSLVVSAAKRIEDPQVIVPDAHAFTGTSTRKSIEWSPEMANIPQLNEFDDAPSVGNISIKRAGKKLQLADPDGTSGQRKWMVPLRRETSNAIEIKWAQLGDGSDSDSDSDSDGDYIRVVVATPYVHNNTLVFPMARIYAPYVMDEPITIVGTDCDGGMS